MRYYFRHCTENAYSDQEGNKVTDWKDAVTFTKEKEADKFFQDMLCINFDFWDMCQCSEEQWEATGVG